MGESAARGPVHREWIRSAYAPSRTGWRPDDRRASKASSTTAIKSQCLNSAYMPWPDRGRDRHPWGVVSRTETAIRLAQTPRATSFEPVVARAFGLAVRSARIATGISQDRMALAAGVDRSFFGKLERGERQPSLGIMLRIAAALGVTGTQLMALTEQVIADNAKVKSSKA